VVAYLDSGDVRTNRLDDTRAFVAKHNWSGMGHQTLDVVEVTVADATGDVANPHLVCAGLLEVEHFYLDALTGLVVDRCLYLHGAAHFASPAIYARLAEPPAPRSGTA
jgi:hypothetical protein